MDQQVDGLGHITKYTYDALDHLLSMTYAYGLTETRTTNYSYDAVGNLSQKKDAFSPQRTTSYGYDNANELVSINYSDGVTPNVSFGYDSLGRRTAMSDGSGSSSYTYDSLSRLIS